MFYGLVQLAQDDSEGIDSIDAESNSELEEDEDMNSEFQMHPSLSVQSHSRLMLMLTLPHLLCVTWLQ